MQGIANGFLNQIFGNTTEKNETLADHIKIKQGLKHAMLALTAYYVGEKDIEKILMENKALKMKLFKKSFSNTVKSLEHHKPTWFMATSNIPSTDRTYLVFAGSQSIADHLINIRIGANTQNKSGDLRKGRKIPEALEPYLNLEALRFIHRGHVDLFLNDLELLTTIKDIVQEAKRSSRNHTLFLVGHSLGASICFCALAGFRYPLSSNFRVQIWGYGSPPSLRREASSLSSVFHSPYILVVNFIRKGDPVPLLLGNSTQSIVNTVSSALSSILPNNIANINMDDPFAGFHLPITKSSSVILLDENRAIELKTTHRPELYISAFGAIKTLNKEHNLESYIKSMSDSLKSTLGDDNINSI